MTRGTLTSQHSDRGQIRGSKSNAWNESAASPTSNVFFDHLAEFGHSVHEDVFLIVGERDAHAVSEAVAR